MLFFALILTSPKEVLETMPITYSLEVSGI